MKIIFAVLVYVFCHLQPSALAGNSAVEGELTSGMSHTCVLQHGRVLCWGGNEFGQSAVPELKNPKMVSAGYYHTCALDENGVACWGQNKFGQTNVPPLKNPKYISAGQFHSCAIDDDGVKCWWYNEQGQAQPPRLSNPTAVSAGADRSCAIADGKVFCWGEKRTDFSRSIVQPRSVSVGKDVCVLDSLGVICEIRFLENERRAAQAVATGPKGICVVEQGQPVGCYSYSEPGPVFRGLKSISLEENSGCGLDEDGIKCWGRGYQNIPVLKNPRLVRAGGSNACALDDDGVKCWGSESRCLNENMPTFRNLTAFSVRDSEFCAVDDQGLSCWPASRPGSRLNSPPPGLSGVRDVHIGRDEVCATTSDAVVCWHQYGAINVKTHPISNPEKMIFSWEGGCAFEGQRVKCWNNREEGKDAYLPFAVRAISGGEYNAILVNDQEQLMVFDGSKKSWNFLGGDPFPLRNTTALSVGYGHVCALDDIGVKCRLFGTSPKVLSMLAVPPLHNPEAITSGDVFACALASGKVQCWGGGYNRLSEIPSASASPKP